MRRDWLILWTDHITTKASIIEMIGTDPSPGFDYDQTGFAIPREASIIAFVEIDPYSVPKVIANHGPVKVDLPYGRAG